MSVLPSRAKLHVPLLVPFPLALEAAGTEVSLPANHGFNGQHTVSPPLYQPPHVPHNRPLVFLIDDSEVIRTLVTAWLLAQGVDVKVFPDGMDVFRWLTQIGSRLPNLILLDVEMPKINGYEVARILNTKPPVASIPIVMLSGHNAQADQRKARQCGAAQYLKKPFTIQDLLQVVEIYLGRIYPTVEAKHACSTQI